MKTFIDSSAFAKRYIDEKGSQEVDDICRNTEVLAVSVLCLPEIVSALNRRVRERRLSRLEYLRAKNRLSEDVADALIINLTPEVIARTTMLLETNVLRALDALHVASGLEWGADLFVSCDQRQVRAASKAGLRTRQIH
ncbi:MAG: type II toxin-antitoxin system VapC family toxin [Acidobacteria bacterium]|nr:type II toxin-antitoxin system VapC family toxin [Acidobacteriota bacterium]